MKFGKQNILYKIDGYKLSHFKQLPPNTTSIYSYVETRSDKKYNETLFFGLQAFIQEYLEGCTVNEDDVLEAEKFYKQFGTPFNKEGWLRIAREFQGKLPIRIKAVPEGSVIPNHNVLATIESTDSETCWLTSWIETAMLRGIWYGSTVATLSYNIRKNIYAALEKSSDDPDGNILYALNDFSSRGVSSAETAGIGGASHLISMQGSDNVEGMVYAIERYGHKIQSASISASEHSTTCAWGREGEKDFYRHMMKEFSGMGIFAAVQDTYDLFSSIEFCCQEFKKELEEKNCRMVLRPDGGDPCTIVLRCLQIVDEKAGTTINSKGYKVLPNCFRIIQGDGVNLNSINDILKTIMDAGFSAENVVYGCGGQLLQAPMRDDLGFAFKCSEVVVNGEVREIFKDPITDPSKRSKSGRLALIKEDGQYKTVKGPHKDDLLQTVFENGKSMNKTTFAEIRKRAWK